MSLPAPDRLAGLAFERHDERLSLVIPVDDQVLPGERRRVSLAETAPRRHVAKIDMPKKLPIEGVGLGAVRTKVCVEPLTVG